MKASLFVLLGAQFGVMAAACTDSTAAPRAIRVFAAASLTAPFEEIAAEYARLHPDRRVDLVCAGSPLLVLQLREGAAADVFASADEPNMQKVVELGRAAGAPRVFAKNRLAIVVLKGNPRGIAALADLARVDLKVALCGTEVPAGRYARQALAKAGVAVRSVSDEANVKALVAKVRLGEVDAGIAYVTDARIDGVEAVALPAAHDVVADYPIAALTGGADRAGGEAFVAFVLSAEGRAILEAHGFAPP